MKRIHLLPAPLLAAMLLTSVCATMLADAEPAKDVVCLQSAKLSLIDAIATAERQLGGHAVAGRYRQDEELGCLVNKPGEYDVTLRSNGQLRRVAVNARTSEIGSPEKGGTILERTSRVLDRAFEADPKAHIPVESRVTPNLIEAIALAERSGGKAQKAHLEDRGGRLGFYVKLVEDGKTHVAWVDTNQLRSLAAN